jgi:hypothetical protein
MNKLAAFACLLACAVVAFAADEAAAFFDDSTVKDYR